MDYQRIQIGLKLDANKNGQLSRKELESLSAVQRLKLRESVSNYLKLIDSCTSSNK